MTRAFSWLAPRGVVAQIRLVILAALLLAQIVTAILFVTFLPRGDGEQAEPPGIALVRAAQYLDVLRQLPEDERDRLIANNPPGRFAIVDTEAPPEIQALRRFEHLPDTFPDALIGRLAAAGNRTSDPPVLAAAFPRPEGGWIMARLEPPDGPGNAPPASLRARARLHWLIATVFLFVIASALVSIWAARRITKPLVRFAGAADRLGRGGDTPPLPEMGPQELRQAIRAFNRMQERLTALLRDRTRMLASISHDLRTPLTRLRLRVEQLTLSADEEEERARLQRDLDAMEQMLNSALSFIRGDGKEEPVERVDLATLLTTIVDAHADLGSTISLDPPRRLVVRGRPASLTRAVENVISNALQHAGSARIALKREGRFAEIVVSDHGPGIPDADKERVFEPFQRLDAARTPGSGGVGLGLSIVRAIATAHGGDVILEDNRPTGLLVRLRLPITEHAAANDDNSATVPATPA